MANRSHPYSHPRSSTRSFSEALPRATSTTPNRRCFSRPRQPLKSLQESTIRTPSKGRRVSCSKERMQTYQPGMHLNDLAENIAVNNYVSSSDSEINDISNSINKDDDFECFMSPRGTHQGINTSNVGKKDQNFSSGNDRLISMLQQQQALLERVLKGQESLELRQNEVEQKLSSLEVKVDQPTVCSPSSSSDGKRKRIVTRALSNKINTLHKDFEVEAQFNKSEPFSSIHNKSVQEAILAEVIGQPNCKFSDNEIKVGIRRCYENMRRIFLEQQSGKEHFVENQAVRRKYRSRRERKFHRRSSVVSKGEMEKYWQFLSLAYFTEESDDPDNPNGLIEHKLEWRSDKLDEFMQVLDARIALKKKQSPGLTARKVRKEGKPSECLPPADAPIWAVKNKGTSCERQTNEDVNEGEEN